VREAASATPDEAVALGVVDLVSPAVADLLATAEGRSVTLLNGLAVRLAVATAPRVDVPPNLYERLLSIVSDPLIVSLLLLAGMIGIAAEMFLPGTFVPITVGVIALLLAFLGLGTLLPGEAAVALILVGLALFAMEFFVPSGGVLGAGAAIAIVLGLSIVLGQTSTALTLRGVLTIFVLVAGALSLLAAAAFIVIARGYISRSEESGGRLL
jgi:membrane-bound serine protease (ClpP class)